MARHLRTNRTIEPEPLCYTRPENAERDGNTDSPFHHVREEAVAVVVVILSVPAKSTVVEENFVHGLDDRVGRSRRSAELGLGSKN